MLSAEYAGFAEYKKSGWVRDAVAGAERYALQVASVAGVTAKALIGPRVRVEIQVKAGKSIAQVFLIAGAAAREVGGAVSFRSVVRKGRLVVVFHFHSSRLASL